MSWSKVRSYFYLEISLSYLLISFLVDFKNVAIEQIYKHGNISAKGGDPIPAPAKLDDLLEKTKRKLYLFNRLTVVYSDPSATHTLARSANAKKFHIIAALPTTESALQHACQTFQGDIITYDLDTVKIRLNRKFYYMAVRRNMFFELKYVPCIIDSSSRRATISRAQQYHMVGKSKGIIISSEAKDQFHIRNPLSIACLGLIFGISEEQAKCAISTMSLKVLVAAESRRLGKSPVLMKYEDIDTSTSEEESEDSEFSDMEVDSTHEKRKQTEISPGNGKPSKKMKQHWIQSEEFLFFTEACSNSTERK